MSTLKQAEVRYKQAVQRIDSLSKYLDTCLNQLNSSMEWNRYFRPIIRKSIKRWPLRRIFHRLICWLFDHKWKRMSGGEEPDPRIEVCTRCRTITDVEGGFSPQARKAAIDNLHSPWTKLL